MCLGNCVLVNWIFQLTERIAWKSFLLLNSFLIVLAHFTFLINLLCRRKYFVDPFASCSALFWITLSENMKGNGFELCCSFDTACWLVYVRHDSCPRLSYSPRRIILSNTLGLGHVLSLAKEIKTEVMCVILDGSHVWVST